MNKIILITPSYRLKNLKIIKKNINFEYILKWIIVYDENKISNNSKLFEHNENIVEIFYKPKKGENLGNSQRNLGLEYVNKYFREQDFFLYFLDDDNIIHDNFYYLLTTLKKDKIYTFDQQRTRYILNGTKPKLYHIDLAMFVAHFKLISEIRFKDYDYNADGIYIEDCYKKNLSNHTYINKVGCYYNYLSRNVFKRALYLIFWKIKNFLTIIGFIKKTFRNKP